MNGDFRNHLDKTAFIFRGYNVTNLGRTAELLAHDAYGPVVEPILAEAEEIAADALKRRIDLVDRVRRGEETDLDSFADAVALIMAVERAHLALLQQFFGVEYRNVRMGIGYSLGEASAVVASGVFDFATALKLPLLLADDCAELGRNVRMGIVFSRAAALDFDAVHRLCVEINCQGRGFIGSSTYLSPNSLLVLGQGDTVDRLKVAIGKTLPKEVHVRKNRYYWPPLHTPIMWQRSIPNRAAVQMHAVGGGLVAPQPPVLSLVTGKESYNDFNSREMLIRWIDHPQRVWDAVERTLGEGIETVVHVGPEPNLFPATYRRLSENVQAQLSGTSPSSLGLRVVSGMARRPWLTALLPSHTALLRAPFLQHVVLEDWLLEQAP
ncbi:MAG: ACP S-malonyltransferase [Planctomycetota bacterium]|nr:MAG: ACP S-malonyltransferase [Planctomycetota bacterium]REJ93980.1 MAG: ACP S-malonyltransferase [Planctomycetota bacterium]REK30960.1 MAG: ACP S-malonyltransferase [Planctomycetota bacterium]REK38212.1 MAG: ACP S-malonyltransferase [Planctomycetota bacterium]